MFLEIFLPAVCAVVLGVWVSKPDTETFFPRANLAVYVAAISTFLRSRSTERHPPKSQRTPLHW